MTMNIYDIKQMLESKKIDRLKNLLDNNGLSWFLDDAKAIQDTINQFIKQDNVPLSSSKAPIYDAAYLYIDKKHLNDAIHGYLSYLNENINIDIMFIDDYLIRCAVLIKQQKKDSLNIKKYLEVFRLYSDVTLEKKIFIFHILDKKKLFKEYIEKLYDDFINSTQDYSKNYRVGVFFDKSRRIFLGDTDTLFIEPTMVSASIEYDKLNTKVKEIYKGLRGEFKDVLKKGDKLKNFKQHIIDNEICRLKNLNIAINPESWIVSIDGEKRLAEFTTKSHQSTEKQKALWENSEVITTITEINNIPKHKTIDSLFNDIISKTNLNIPNGLCDFFVDTGVIIEQHHLPTGEVKEYHPLTPSEREHVKLQDKVIRSLILKHNLVSDSSSDEALLNYFNKKHSVFAVFKSEIISSFKNILFLKDDSGLLERLSIDRLVLLTEALIVDNKTLCLNKGKTDLQKSNQKDGLKDALQEILDSEKLVKFYIYHRNDIAHPAIPLNCLEHYFIFGIFLKIMKKSVYIFRPL